MKLSLFTVLSFPFCLTESQRSGNSIRLEETSLISRTSMRLSKRLTQFSLLDSFVALPTSLAVSVSESLGQEQLLSMPHKKEPS